MTIKQLRLHMHERAGGDVIALLIGDEDVAFRTQFHTQSARKTEAMGVIFSSAKP